MAQAILQAEIAKRRLPMEVNSAGLLNMGGRPAASEAKLVCERAGTPLPKLESRCMSVTDVEWADIILVTEPWQRDEIVQAFAVTSEREVRLLSEFDPWSQGESVNDPVGGSTEEFEACYERLRDCIEGFLSRYH